ncbi:MAG: AAA family ATPase, partial [Candidatus Delongbacteria bacterium]|nr:AAA family ATPase [Candidatus Delongbacteria bacterium]
MLLKFIPGHFVEIYDEISKNNYIRTEGFVMFAGLSGFTAMSEKLSAKDKEGSEEISRILNTIFEDLINIIHKRGGSVYKFGGDALTVFFPKIVHARSVSNCGMELLEVMRKYDSIQTIQDKFKIEIKIGTTFGEVVIGQLGRDEKDYFIAGKALDKACECEHIAKKGESIVSCSLRFKLGMCEFKSKSEGYFIARELEELFNSKLSIKPIYNLNRIESFARKVLLNKDKEGDFGHGELRNCTTLFMSFSGIEYDYDFNYSVLNDLVTTVFKITSKYGGFINKVDMGGKGNKILILFGAPIATEKNEEFACRCALEIIESLNGSIKAKIGINSGNIYFGTIGSKNRMEFTVIGNAVNLSARLMTSCKDNEIIISKTTLSKISDTVTKNERGLILKGIKEKFIVSTLKGFYKKITYTRVKPIGRDGEIEEYRRIIHSGKIKKIFITAEAGLGKSVLAKEFEEIAGHNGKVFYAECLSHTSENPYYVIKELLNRFLDGISTNKIFALKQILSDVKEDSNLDIYANFMGLYHTKVRRDESMKNIIDDLTVSVCLNLLSRYKTYIFIEDVHWIDDQSLKILKKLLDLTGEMNCVFHLIFRPDDKLNDLRADGHDYAFEIEGFGKEEGESYLKQKFNIMKIPKKVYDLIYSKSKGNPFYMDEIILSIKSKNGIKEQKDGSYVINQKITEIEIPDNINDIILSRLDKIDGNSKRILKIASVIGRIFQINVLNQLKELQQKIGELNLKSRLSDLMDMNFTLFEINKEDECLFKHAITRDVIYEILPYSIRRKYHEE